MAANTVYFYPGAVALTSGTWTVYFHGIRGRWKSMMLDYGDRRFDKTLGDFILYHGEESTATSLAVTAASAEGTLASIGSVTLNQGDNRGVIEKGSTVNINGRVFQVKIDHNPPVAGRTFRIMGMEFGSKLSSDMDA
jgi:hypothetical protein